MKVSSATLSAIRYGYGLRVGEPPPGGPDALIGQLAKPDPAKRRFSGSHRTGRLRLFRENRRLYREKQKGKPGTEFRHKLLEKRVRAQKAEDVRSMILRPMLSPHGFRERLVAFWADHFAVQAKNRTIRLALPLMFDEAIRPNIAGRFADMLIAVTRQPAMLAFLDQGVSTGPGSVIGRITGRGLNENLARELLELHTLGVDAGYTQQDVREFAELLTGLSFGDAGFKFRPGASEPGAETVLGKSYGGNGPSLDDIDAALEDLSLRPETAHHLARKLAVHFIGPDPDPALVRRMAGAYLASGGALPVLYETMLADPSAWAGIGAKIKPPHEFVVSTLRALAVEEATIRSWNNHRVRKLLAGPMTAMGQPPFRPPGPDGWPEEAASWITPARLAARLNWVSGMAAAFGSGRDPRDLLRTSLGELASPELQFVVNGAESRIAGTALIFASPEFNRR